jgi:hypothetical protein
MEVDPIYDHHVTFCGTVCHPPAPSHRPIDARPPAAPLELGGTRRHCQRADRHRELRIEPSVTFNRNPWWIADVAGPRHFVPMISADQPHMYARPRMQNCGSVAFVASGCSSILMKETTDRLGASVLSTAAKKPPALASVIQSCTHRIGRLSPPPAEPLGESAAVVRLNAAGSHGTAITTL